MSKRYEKKHRHTTPGTEVTAWVITGLNNLKQMTCEWRLKLEKITGRSIRFAYDLKKKAMQVICTDQAVHLRIGEILAAGGFACREQKVYIRAAARL